VREKGVNVGSLLLLFQTVVVFVGLVCTPAPTPTPDSHPDDDIIEVDNRPSGDELNGL
jgi:hypothetical protein